MAGSIGGETFLEFIGNVDTAKGQKVAEITRPGVNGRAFRKDGKKGDPFEVTTTTALALDAAEKTQLDAYKAKMGSLVSVTDAAGNTFTNIMVNHVRQTGTQPTIGASDGSTQRLLTCVWTLTATETA